MGGTVVDGDDSEVVVELHPFRLVLSGQCVVISRIGRSWRSVVCGSGVIVVVGRAALVGGVHDAY